MKEFEPKPTADIDVSSQSLPTDVLPISTGRDEPCRNYGPSFELGDVLSGKLRVMAELGAGGMGEVYLAWHTKLEQEVAVKALLINQADYPAASSRFRKSIALHAQADVHRNIVSAMDAGDPNP